MKLLPLTIWIYLLLYVIPVRADDIDAYYPGGFPGRVFLHVMMDLGDSDVDTAICTYGVDCAPPFLTEAAYHHLRDVYSEGDAVSAPGIFKAVLAAVLEDTLFDDLYLALLIPNHSGNQVALPDGRSGGGTILRGYRRLKEHRADFVTTLKATPILSAENAHHPQPKESYFEWLRYIRGGEVALGENTIGNYGQLDPAPDYDRDIMDDGRYLTPFLDPQECPKLNSILFTLGSPLQDEDLDDQIAAELPLAGEISAEKLLAYLHDSNASLLPGMSTHVSLQKTWVVSSRDRPGNAARLAAAGGGGAVLYVNEPAELQAGLASALAEIVAVSGHSMETAFVEDSFLEGRILDNVFMSLFQLGGSAGGQGNLKKLKLRPSPVSDESTSHDDNAVFSLVVDVRGEPAFELAGDDPGQLRFDALTFWTDVATLPPGDGKTIPYNADGRVVARGGAGQKIDGFSPYENEAGEAVQYFIGDTNGDVPVDGYLPRQLFYEPPTGNALASLDANPVTVEALRSLLDPIGELTDEQLLNLIRWARGQDTDNSKSSARGWILGEVMHSRPVALNYGATPGYSAANPNIRVLFGSGDGIFHSVENTDVSGRESGREVFGLYLRESIAAIPSRHDDYSTAMPRYYGVDGAPVIFKRDGNGDGTLDYTQGDEAYVYFGLRRGGSRYFALDISNPDAVPRLIWEIGPTAGGPFGEMGLTFSTPLVGKVNHSGEPVDVLVFAGGYDGGWNASATARHGKDLGADDDAVGNAIYIVNARTGELVWKAVKGNTGSSSNTQYEHAGLVDSIPSAVSALTTPAGIIHRLYVGDSGGALWRVDLPPGGGGDDNHRKDQWFITQLADLGADAGETGGSDSADRRFFHAPDIVRSFDETGEFDGVLMQSGNREDPNETLVENALFFIKDRHTATGSALVRALNNGDTPTARYHYTDLPDQTNCMIGTEATPEVEGATACGDRTMESGWKVRFLQPGEKGLSTPLTDGGRIFASTFTPGDVSPCSAAKGQGQLYVMHLSNATAVANKQRVYDLGPGIPPAPVPVGDAIFLPGGGIDPYDIDGDGERDIVKLLPSEAEKIYRTYWREPGIDPL